jgi:hypothetical protein
MKYFIVYKVVKFLILISIIGLLVYKNKTHGAPLEIPSHEPIANSLHQRHESSNESMNPFPTIDPQAVIDRTEYVRNHVAYMIKEEEEFGFKENLCRGLNISFGSIAAVTSLSSMVISSLGASKYLDPQMTNIISIILGISTGTSMWAANQCKRAAHTFHEQRSKIQKSLGMPSRLISEELVIDVSPPTQREIQSSR